MAKLTTSARATATYTAAGVFTDTQTVTVGGKVYTSQTTLTNVDGNFFKGADAAAGCQNLYDAINLTGTPGTQYAAAMTRNNQVRATAVTATTVVVEAKAAGAAGNLIACTETQTNGSWSGSGVLVSGSGDSSQNIEEIITQNQLPSDTITDLRRIFGGA